MSVSREVMVRRTVAVALIAWMVAIAGIAWTSLPNDVAFVWSSSKPIGAWPRATVFAPPGLLAYLCIWLLRHRGRITSDAAAWRLLLFTAGPLAACQAFVIWSNSGRSTWKVARVPWAPFGGFYFWWVVALTMALLVRGTMRAPARYRSTVDAPDVDAPSLWSATATNWRPLLPLLVFGGVAVASMIVIGTTTGSSALAPAAFALAAVAGLVIICLPRSRARVTVGPAGVIATFGYWRWPTRRYRFTEITDASPIAIDARPGWHHYADMELASIRRGEGLRLDLKGRPAFAVTVDDAGTAAGLIRSFLRA